MSYSSDPVRDAARHFDVVDAREARIEEAERIVAEEFTAACAQGDANALCLWAGMTTDWERVKRPVSADQKLPQRALLLNEVMVQAMEWREGPSISEAMQLLLNLAYGGDCQNLQGLARTLINRMAATHARHSVVIE